MWVTQCCLQCKRHIFFSLFLTKPWKNFYRKLIVLPNVQCAGSSSGCLNTNKQKTQKTTTYNPCCPFLWGLKESAFVTSILWLWVWVTWLFLRKPWKNFYRQLIVLPNVQYAGSSTGCLNIIAEKCNNGWWENHKSFLLLVKSS